VSSQYCATLVLVLHLATITWIDFRKFIIPNLLNLSLGICGLLTSQLVLHWSFWEVFVEAAAVYVVFFGIAEIYRYLRGNPGLGGGDIKFLFAATFWIGALAMPWLILVASISGLVAIILIQLAHQKIGLGQRIAFGPHLALGLLVTWLFRDTLSLMGN
jgi:leader peptidase (prepilin peptidase) / N-methyltransferase